MADGVKFQGPKDVFDRLVLQNNVDDGPRDIKQVQNKKIPTAA